MAPRPRSPSSSDVQKTAKKRKQRPHYSCEDCRRLKMKCDRQVPCSNCVRRHREDQCIEGQSRRSLPNQRSPSREEARSSGSQLPDQLPDVADDSSSFTDNDARHPAQIPHIDRVAEASDLTAPSLTLGPAAPLVSNPWMPQPDVLHFTPGIQTADPVGSLGIDKREIPEASSIGTTMTDPQAFLQPYVPRLASGSGYSIALDLDDAAAEETGFGTLVLSHGGRSKYLGPTAASEWLKDSETQEIPDTPSISRATSPKLQPGSGALPTIPPQTLSPICFPFNNVSAYVSMATLLSKLPAKEEAVVLIDSYYRYCAWHHDVVPRPGLQKIFDRLYPPAPHVDDLIHPVSPQELALVFILLAQGTLYNLEMPNNDPSAEGWLNLSERALVKGNFFANNTIPAVQTLHLMAHYHLHMDKGRRGDYAWPLWGLTMRLIQAMGMHRDGARWNLPQEVVEERRKVFWECNAADTFQAHCFSRPCTINPEHCDTAFPTIPLSPSGEKGYTILRYELSQLSGEILNMAMKVRRPPYSTVTDLHQRLCTFEQNLPFSLRCRAAMLATPSRFPDSITAIESSPEPSRRSMALSFQQTSLALNISETIIFLHRPYFARVLYSDTQDRVRSAYATSYLAVIERCGVIISMVADIHSRFPTVSTRQWHLWYHVFNSAVCVGTLALRDPHNPLTGFAMTQIEAAIRLMTMLIQSGASSPRPVKNLQWLLQLRNRALAKLDATKGARTGDETDDQDDPESVEVLGWRTRLVERASQKKQTTKTIESPSAAQAAEALMNSLSSSFGYQGSQSDAPTNEFSSSTQAMTDSLLHDFWDPMILQDVFNNTNNQTPTIDSSTTNWWEALGDNPNTFQPR